MQEAELIHRAVDNLYVTSGIVGDVQLEMEPRDKATDGTLRLMHGARTVELPFVSKRHLTLKHVEWLKSLQQRVIVVFAEAPDGAKDQLRENNLSYLEASGNAFLALDNFFLFIDTAKTARSTADKSSKAFSKTGIRVVYALLSNPNAVQYSYRKLAELSGASIDTVGRVLHELVNDKYLVKTGNKGFTIIDTERLVNDWTTMFNKTLRPKLTSRVFDFQESNVPLSTLISPDTEGLISGELAADKMTNYLIGNRAIVYVDGSIIDFALANGLKPVKDGRITVIEKFWEKSENRLETFVSMASPVLVYADLMNDPSPRNLATAKIIFNDYVHEFLQ